MRQNAKGVKLKNQKIAVIGAGITGLSAAKLFDRTDKVTIYESCGKVGGIARPKLVDGIAYHTVGGHCFNSKYPEVLDFVFNFILPEKFWHKVNRKAVIDFGRYQIPYPIEYSLNEIYKNDPEFAKNILKDFIIAQNDKKDSESLEDWFINNFGGTLAKKYFIPYNEKIWGIEASNMNYNWVKDKIPLPDIDKFLNGLFTNTKDNMPHVSFYYPSGNSQSQFIEKLSAGLDICLNTEVTRIIRTKRNTFKLYGDYYLGEFDQLISTIPLNALTKKIQDCPKNILEYSKKLKYNKITTMLWKSTPTNNTWTYLPSNSHKIHRMIHIGNFFNPTNDSVTITEALGVVSYEEMINQGKEITQLISPLDYHVSNHAYVVNDQNIIEARECIHGYVKSMNIYSIGRFGSWDYHNMDICIKQALDLFQNLRGNLSAF